MTWHRGGINFILRCMVIQRKKSQSNDPVKRSEMEYKITMHPNPSNIDPLKPGLKVAVLMGGRLGQVALLRGSGVQSP